MSANFGVTPGTARCCNGEALLRRWTPCRSTYSCLQQQIETDGLSTVVRLLGLTSAADRRFEAVVGKAYRALPGMFVSFNGPLGTACGKSFPPFL